ncbi:MAG TPA: SDR family oxidoreductase, partial [Nannocystis sp.]
MKSSAANTDRIAVAGGRGFIGRAISRTLLARRKQVLAFGREGLSDPTIITTLIWAAGGREGGDIARLAESHVLAPLRVIAHAPNLRRLVYLSSGEVYGPGAVPFHEDSPRLGRSPYAQAKIRGEDELTAACARAGIALIILRPGVVYGPGQAATMLIPALLAALRAGQPFRTTAGEQTRDFLHIDDLVRLLVRCLDDDAPPGTYNAGTGVETPVRAVIQTL